VTKDCENRWYSKTLRLCSFKPFFAILANFVKEREQFTRKFVNLAKNRKFDSEREKLPILQFFLQRVVRVRKIANFSTACKLSTKALSAILCLSMRRVPCCVELHSGTVLVLLSLLSLANSRCSRNWVNSSPLK